MSQSNSSRARREEPEEGEVYEGPVQAGPSRPTNARPPQPDKVWTNPLSAKAMLRQSSWSPEKGEAAKLPPRPTAAVGFPSDIGTKPSRQRSRSRDRRRERTGSDQWVEKETKRSDTSHRERERDDEFRRPERERRDQYSEYGRDGDRHGRGREDDYYRPSRDDGYGRSPRQHDRYKSSGTRKGSPPRRDPSPRNRDRQYSGRSGSGNGNGNGHGYGYSDRNERGSDRYTAMYDDERGGRDGVDRRRDGDRGYAAERRHHDREYSRTSIDGHRQPLTPMRNGSNGQSSRDLLQYDDIAPPPPPHRSPRMSPTPPRAAPRTPQEEGEVSSPAPPPPRSAPPTPPAYDPLSDAVDPSYKPKKLLRHTTSHTKLRSTPPPARSQYTPPPPDGDRPSTPPTPPPPVCSPPPPPPEPDRGPNPYLAEYRPINKALEDTKSRAPVDLSKAPTGPRIDPSRGSGGQAPDRDAIHPSTRPASPVPAAKPERHRPEKFLMWTEKLEREKLGRVFEGVTTLADYDMGTKLGEGTFGVVTKAVEKGSGRIVALKKLITHNPRDGVSVTTVREIKILKALEHENVVPIRDMVVHRKHPADRTERGEVFMVFPYMDHDLCGLLANTAFQVTQSLAKLLLKQLLEGLAYIHSQNIVHRDIKTANILVGRTGLVMIADFGLARTWTPKDTLPPHAENEYTNMVVTRWYRAPELLLGCTKYGPEIDLWSTGCVFGEMYMRQPVLCGESDRDQLYKIASRCGPLNDESFPGWADLPGFPEAVGHPWDKTPQDKSLFDEVHSAGSLSKVGLELLGLLLRLDPVKRISAVDALDHAWFWTAPLPGTPKEGLITVDSSHEFTTRRPEKPAPIPPPRHQPVQQPFGGRPLGHRRPPPPTMNLGGPASSGMNMSYTGQTGPSYGQPLPPHQQHHLQQQHQQQAPPYSSHTSFAPNQNPYGAPIIANPSQMPLPMNGHGQGHGHGHGPGRPGPALAPNGYPVGMPPAIPGQTSMPIQPSHNHRPAMGTGLASSRAQLPAAPFKLAGDSAPPAGLPSKPGHVPRPPFALREPAGASYAQAAANGAGAGMAAGGGWAGGIKRGPPGPSDWDTAREDKRPKPMPYGD